MKLTLKSLSWVLVALLLTSCASKNLPGLNEGKINRSALYDPPSVTLTEDTVYHFAEGDLTGTGQTFHSHHSYLRALVIGSE